jgi:ankyrin repeat protein
VKYGAKVATPWRRGITALFLAAQEGHHDMVRTLAIDHKHPTDVREENHDFTPVFAAAQRGHVAVLRVLVDECGCDLTVRSRRGLTPFMVAAQAGKSEALEWLARSGANINDTLPSGASALYLACQEDHLAAVQTLHFLGVSIDQPRNDGTTPAFIAALKGNFECLRFLAEKKANLLEPNNEGITPWQASRESQAPHRSETLVVLAAHGARGPGACVIFLRKCFRSQPKRSNTEEKSTSDGANSI